MASGYTITITGTFGSKDLTFTTIRHLRHALKALDAVSFIPHTEGEIGVSRHGYIVTGKRLTFTDKDEEAEDLAGREQAAPAPAPAPVKGPTPQPLAHGSQPPVRTGEPTGQIGPVTPKK